MMLLGYSRQQLLFVLILPLLGIACREEHTIPAEQENTVLDSTYQVLADVYFWSDYLPAKENFYAQEVSSPEHMVALARTYSPVNPKTGIPTDRWSAAGKKEDWTKSLQGQFHDFGCTFRFLKEDDLRIALVQLRSAAGEAGLRRGTKVKFLNRISAVVANQLALLEQVSTQESLELITEEAGKYDTVVLKAKDYQFESTLDAKVFATPTAKVGYVHLQSFIKTTVEEFKTTLDNFYAQGVESIIVDLRYNGGGLVSAMEGVANLLAPAKASYQHMYSTKHNENYANFDSKVYFGSTSLSENIRSISFITSGNTASASEMLIQVLKPYVKVQVVGKTTHGKLMGMYTLPIREYIVAPVSYKVLNAEGEHDQFLGLTPDVYQNDDLEKDFVAAENCIGAALANASPDVPAPGGRRPAQPSGADDNLPQTELVQPHIIGGAIGPLPAALRK